MELLCVESVYLFAIKDIIFLDSYVFY